MGRPRTRDAVPDMRSHIVTAATSLFEGQGYANTTLRQVALAIDMTPAALYYHFPAKSDLACALVEPYLDELESLPMGRGEAPRNAEEVCALVGAYLDVLVRHRVVARLVSCDISLCLEDELRPRVEAVEHQMVTALVGRRPNIERRVRGVAALGAALAGATRLSPTPQVKEHLLATVLAAAALPEAQT